MSHRKNCKGKRKGMKRSQQNDSIEDEEDRMSEKGFAGMNVTKNEALGYEKRRKGKNNPQRMLQTDNG